MGWLVGGLYEEIVFHGFIFTKLEKILPGQYALPTSFVICNILFALYHLQLGTEGVITALVAGCVYHALMICNKKNMWYAIFCHAMYDTIALTYIYAGY
jgi:membrane protease YdiL (CAAX protease family)